MEWIPVRPVSRLENIPASVCRFRRRSSQINSFNFIHYRKLPGRYEISNSETFKFKS